MPRQAQPSPVRALRDLTPEDEAELEDLVRPGPTRTLQGGEFLDIDGRRFASGAVATLGIEHVRLNRHASGSLVGYSQTVLRIDTRGRQQIKTIAQDALGREFAHDWITVEDGP